MSRCCTALSPAWPALPQGWYLSLGKRTCSVCGATPTEPALCLRCGVVLCCNGRRCLGPARQVRFFAQA